ncbi:YphA family membrane protein [Halalkalibacter alkalisediminis]|uniref:Uncharacterized protein n=1 Tax=Halalkalibacter alkalisediminis TaxID=935616 RepID=A0ABV6NGH0_9BACI|nr:hypothetical protein [Halalkalibacter alkalisediminis]
MEGVYAYWIGWGLWTIISFFWPKTKRRMGYAILILALLIVLPLSIQFGQIQFHLAFVLFSIYLSWHMKSYEMSRLIHVFIVSITIAAAHAGFQMLLIFDPVIEYTDSRWMASCIIAIIAFFLSRNLKDRLYVALIGLVQGELLTSMVLVRHMRIEQTIGDLYFFDIVAIVSVLFSIVWGFQQISIWIADQLISESKQRVLKQSS